MKKIITFFIVIATGLSGYSQVVFESNLSSWAGGNPTDWMGSATNIAGANVVEQTVGVTYGTSMASLINTSGTHQRFTTQNVPVTGGATYEIKMWIAGAMGQLRTGFYDATNAAYNTYNPYVNVGTVSGGNLVLVTQQVTVPSTCANGQFILSLHSTDPTFAGPPFYLGIIVDSVSVTEIVPVPAPVVSIYDIQFTTAPSGDSPEVGNIVSTYGIVTGVIGFGADAGRFFIQDGDGPWNGIYVYNTTPVSLGDSVMVTGTITEYFGLTEFTSVTIVDIISSGNPQPTPIDVPTGEVNEEQYECVLVRVIDAICNNPDAGFGQFIVNDGSGDRIVDDQIYSYTAVLNNAYNVTGVAFLTFGDVKIYPRMSSDISVTGFAGIEENDNFSIYPNPASHTIFITVNPTDMINIYNINGSLVYQSIGEKIIDVSGFTPGLYQIMITSNNSVSNHKLIVE